MSEADRDILSALQGHERERARLAAELCDMGATADHQTIFMSAQILRHRIEMALLSSRLAVRAAE